MAQLLREAGRTESAAVFYRQLATRFGNVDCRAGKTGQQLVDELPADDLIRKALIAPTWPAGKVSSREEKPSNRNILGQRNGGPVDLELVEPGGPLFDDVTISYDVNQKVLVAQDGLGEKRFRLRVEDVGAKPLGISARLNPGPYTPTASYASANGGLLILAMGHQLMAVDTLRGGEGSSTGTLWTHDLTEQIGGFPSTQNLGTRPHVLPWGPTRYVAQDSAGRRIGSIGPILDDAFAFQRMHDLYCVDPLDGKTIWMRKNVGLGNDLFGDHELLFVAPPGEGESLVLRASTGELLGTRRVAPFDRRMATLGRKVLSWEPASGGHEMRLHDAWENKTLWSYKFAGNSKAALVGQEVVGVLQPDGEFTLIALSDGKQLIKERLEAESGLQGIVLLRSPQGYLLVTNATPRHESNVVVQPVRGAPIMTGHVYAFERGTGRKLWPAPVSFASQGLMMNQPSQLPVLAFARQLVRPGPPGVRDPKTSLLFIDKRTGQVAYSSDQLPGSFAMNLELTGDPQAHTVTMSMPQLVLTLDFSDETDKQTARRAPLDAISFESPAGRVATDHPASGAIRVGSR